MIHSHKIRNLSDPYGAREAEINKLAIKLAKLNPERDTARILFLREKLVSSAMSFFFITGDNVEAREDGVTHQGHYAQVDELFIDVLMKVLNAYDPDKGLFTHMLKNRYKYARLDAAMAAAAEDTALGGSEEGSPPSLDEKAWRDGDGTTTVADVAGAEPSHIIGGDDDLADEALLLNVISLITSFLGKSGKAANETRKLYTKTFFSETLTRIVKTRGEGELGGLERQQKGLFSSVEIGFQDSYTASPCRSIHELWLVGFAEDLEPFLARQLLHGRSVHGGVVAAGIAARAMQVALACDACDQKRGNMQSVILSLPAFFRRGGGGGGKAQHERASTRIRQRRF